MTAPAPAPAPAFAGFRHPTTTPVPDELIDHVMHTLSGGELKVVLYIIRRTLGFKKLADDISLDQICAGIVKSDGERLDHGTGLSRETASRAIRGLVQKGIIVQTKHGPAPATYRLHFEDDATPNIPALRKKSENPTSGLSPLSSPVPPAEKSAFAAQEVGFSDPQQTVFQETDSRLRGYVTTTTSESLDVATAEVAVVQDGEGETPNLKPDPPPDQELARWLAEAAVAGDAIDPTTRRCQDLIARVVRRADWGDEVDDILSHAEATGLGAGWVIERLGDLAAISPHTRRGFRWRGKI